MRWEIDLGSMDTQEALESHLAERGIAVDDIWAVAADGVPRRREIASICSDALPAVNPSWPCWYQ